MSDQEELLAFGRRWAEAEVAADTETLTTMVHPEFRLVGPLGFVLDRDAWLHRYTSGDLATTELTWDQVQIKIIGDTAIAIGRQAQKVSYRGRPNDGDFRITHVFVRDAQSSAGWVIAGIHLSQLMKPPQGGPADAAPGDVAPADAGPADAAPGGPQ